MSREEKILGCLKTCIFRGHNCHFYCIKKINSFSEINEFKKVMHHFMLSGQNTDALFLCHFLKYWLIKQRIKNTLRLQTNIINLQNGIYSFWEINQSGPVQTHAKYFVCVCACVCVTTSKWGWAVARLSKEMTLWKRPPEEIKHTAICWCSQMASQRVDFPSSRFQPVLSSLKATASKPYWRLQGGYLFVFQTSSVVHRYNLRMGWKANEHCYVGQRVWL